ncbi:hypothetical protein [Alicyclobacillus sp. SO9]|uniref:hypothetical protein n=1 Tax=Alicyclobacillus sp. SO9 TaxID=2665646 RepID=UPI0018E85A7B|nr:hypothetical protein [Alicyclobacillus sp. SO9]QQE80806.1 hypothetical protein GI364_10725 [Alicyclobacillus sp. SO9]
MTDPRVEIVSRMRGLKEDLQEQLEIGLANALGTVRERENDVQETKALRRAEQSDASSRLNAATLQYRAAYRDMLSKQLECRLANLEAAKSVAAERKHQVKQAYIETNQWVHLEETQQQRLKQERDRKNQAEADDMAVQRYFSQSGGSR